MSVEQAIVDVICKYGTFDDVKRATSKTINKAAENKDDKQGLIIASLCTLGEIRMTSLLSNKQSETEIEKQLTILKIMQQYSKKEIETFLTNVLRSTQEKQEKTGEVPSHIQISNEELKLLGLLSFVGFAGMVS